MSRQRRSHKLDDNGTTVCADTVMPLLLLLLLLLVVVDVPTVVIFDIVYPKVAPSHIGTANVEPTPMRPVTRGRGMRKKRRRAASLY